MYKNWLITDSLSVQFNSGYLKNIGLGINYTNNISFAELTFKVFSMSFSLVKYGKDITEVNMFNRKRKWFIDRLKNAKTDIEKVVLEDAYKTFVTKYMHLSKPLGSFNTFSDLQDIVDNAVKEVREGKAGK